MEAVCRHTVKQKTISKRHVFLIEKCFEDARQDEKHVRDLLESITKPTDPVKEELRQKLFKKSPIWIENQENQGLHFSGVRKNPGFDQRSLRGPMLTPFLQYLAPLGGKNICQNE